MIVGNERLSVGRVLHTRKTMSWSQNEIDRCNDIEKRTAFTNFSLVDEGRSREKFRMFNSAEDCRDFVSLYNEVIGLRHKCQQLENDKNN